MRRAVREDQKGQRRQAIMEVAWRMFQEKPFVEINILEVAQAAGLAKGTLYLYFATKEELFLSIQEEQFGFWFDVVDQELGREEQLTREQIVEHLTISLAERPAFLRLLAITHGTLERNVALEGIVRFKRMVRERLLHTGALLDRQLHLGGPQHGARLLLQIYALVIGIESLSDMNEAVRSALAAAPELELFRIDFAAELRRALHALICGFSQTM
jgi:AcrR family transcriptional regulator